MFKAIAAIAGTLGLGLVVAAGWFVVHLIQGEQALADQLRAAKAQVVVTQAQGRLDTAAATTTAAVVTRLQPIIQREKETVSEIQAAPGSDVAVDPRSARAFYGGLCAQPWRAGDPGCRADDPAGPEPAPGLQPPGFAAGGQ